MRPVGHPAIGRDEVAIVLHGRGPVVHEVLIDRVRVNERLAFGVGEEKLPDALFFAGLIICCVHQPDERQSCNGRSSPFSADRVPHGRTGAAS